MLLNITMKVLNVVGARPNFMKIAPIVEEMKKTPGLNGILVHTGQHYDSAMSKVFFEDRPGEQLVEFRPVDSYGRVTVGEFVDDRPLVEAV